jgi:hypothetical protein
MVDGTDLAGPAATLIWWWAAAVGQVMPEQVEVVDARSLAMGGATVASFESGTGGAVNPATLEGVVSHMTAVSVVTRFQSQSLSEAEWVVAVPIDDWSIAATARGGLGISGTTTDALGNATGTSKIRTGSVGFRAAATPIPVLSAGIGARVARLWADDDGFTRPIVDAGMVWRPATVPGLSVGAATLGFGLAPKLNLGAAIALDDELLGEKAPPIEVAVQAGWSPEGAKSLGAGIEVQPHHAMAIRGGLGIAGGGVSGSVGLGFRSRNVLVDWMLARAPTEHSGRLLELRHGLTLTVRGRARRARALAIQRAQREEAAALHVAGLVDAAAERAAETTSRNFAESTLRRVRELVQDMELEPVEQARARQLLDEAQDAIDQGLWDVGQQMALDVWELMRGYVETLAAQVDKSEAALTAERARVDTLQRSMDDLETDYLRARREAEREARARLEAALTPAPVTAEPAPATPAVPTVTDKARSEAEALFLAGMDRYTVDDFAGAAEKWRGAKALNPQLHGIDAHIGNAATKAATLEKLK